MASEPLDLRPDTMVDDEETVEEIAIRKLRSLIPDVIRADDKFDDDYFLLQWLKSQNLDLGKTNTMIRDSLKWRKENDIDRLLYEDFPKELKDDFRIYLFDRDRDGTPISSFPVGFWDVREFVEKHGKAPFIRFLSQIFIKSEKIMIDYNKQRNKNNPPGTRITSKSTTGLNCIISAENYSMKQARSLKSVMTVIECSKNFDSYFPQLVEKAYVINVDRFFTFIVKLVTPFLKIPSIDIFDHNKDIWKPFILERVDPEQIYPEFGGVRTSKHQGVVFIS